MARLVRIIRASKLSSILKYFTSSESTEAVQQFLTKYAGVTRLFSILFVVILLNHFTACMWYFTAKIDNFGHDTWIYRYGFENEPKIRLYIICLYWSL
jgi:hyperpolarization activated cyclic nucleotide-gated potassium channel 2